MSATETADLIGSDKVQGTRVYGPNGEAIGVIERLMIDKSSGVIAYAVLSFGGFLGIGDDHYPLPWDSLSYDTGLGGYRTSVSEAQLHEAPRFARSGDWDWADAGRSRTINDYYDARRPGG